ncbi:Transducin/WD40 repeat-like superfamily protein [Raphanus sativus]|uniref:Protein JINGUBANG n=1 Tax=Raphanus sativus TaxID=3726 RepID=A0A6J0JE47_RAPSA|nr:protein JINGUBANG [Raphanus sativus]KAJ4890130.1 Transducin/WD40 repeat-like superfamily protein [Raphanus sativus]
MPMVRRSIQEGVLMMSSSSSSTTTSSNGTDSSDDSLSPSASSKSFVLTTLPPPITGAYKPLAVLSAHAGSVSSLALCGEFLLSASQGKDIIVWQQPDLKIFAKFGQGDGSVKALVSVGSKVFTAHQDSRIRVWKVSRRRGSENAFRLVDTLPTTKDYLGKFMKQSNYVQTRRNHKRLWIEHADSISCLAVHAGIIYSGSWDKTLKVWRLSDLKCLESIKAHDDAINGLVAGDGRVYSASADGKIKIWGKEKRKKADSSLSSSSASSWSHVLKATLEGHAEVSVNSVVVSGEGKWVYGGGSDGFVMGWEKREKGEDFEEWRLGFEMRGHKMAVLCMCVVGDMVCSGSADKSIGLWRREESGRLCKFGVIQGHEGPVKCLQASPNNVGAGFMLYSGSLDKSIRVWWVPKQVDVEEEKKPSFKTLLMQQG